MVGKRSVLKSHIDLFSFPYVLRGFQHVLIVRLPSHPARQTQNGALRAGLENAALRAADSPTSKGGSVRSDQQLDVFCIIPWRGSCSSALFMLQAWPKGRAMLFGMAAWLPHVVLLTAAKYKH